MIRNVMLATVNSLYSSSIKQYIFPISKLPLVFIIRARDADIRIIVSCTGFVVSLVPLLDGHVSLLFISRNDVKFHVMTPVASAALVRYADSKFGTFLPYDL